MIDWVNESKAPAPKSGLFNLALLGPCLLLFSYTFVFKELTKYWPYVLAFHLLWVVVSVVFCSIWSATKGLRGSFEWGSMVGGLAMFTVVQAFLHIVIFCAACLPVLSLLN